MKHLAEDLNDVVKIEKKDLLGKLETQGNELKRKIEMETNEIRFEIQNYYFLNIFLSVCPILFSPFSVKLHRSIFPSSICRDSNPRRFLIVSRLS